MIYNYYKLFLPCNLFLLVSFFGSIHAQELDVYHVPSLPVALDAPEQPIPFNHEFHSELGLTCDTCHVGSDNGREMILPSTETCVACHSVIPADKPNIQKLMSYHESNQIVPWVRVYRINPGITWSHKTHIEAELSCQTCHGPIEKREKVAMETAVVAMASCIGCHQASDVKADCYTCHAWPSSDVIDYDYSRYLPQ